MDDMPYSLLKQDKRAYEIMLLRDQYGNTFNDIAKDYEISVARVIQIYNRLKVKQANLYVNHIAVVLRHKSTTQVKEVYYSACECYQNRTYACAYLEKKYKDILAAYRDGEPGMPKQFIQSMPPFKPNMGEKTTIRVIEMREVEKASYVKIADELQITSAKAKHIYDMFYHKQVLEFVRALEQSAESYEEKSAIWEYWFEHIKSSKKRFDVMIKMQEGIK